MALFLKAISTHVPGKDGERYGNFIKTKDILGKMQSEKDFDCLFVLNNLGIESVSAFKSTIDDFHGIERLRNIELYDALKVEVLKANAIAEKSSSKKPYYIGHIHIGANFHPIIAKEMEEITESVAVAGSTMILNSGCAGILAAIKLAERLIDSNGFGDVLITGENNMLPFAYNRRLSYATRKNLNQWLWPAIFGEGVAAMVVGSRAKKGSWRLQLGNMQKVANEYRVKESILDHGRYGMEIRAKEVRETFEKGISSCLGSYDLNDAFKVLIHESNPKIVKNILNKFQVDLAKSFSISAFTGSLACVSGFTLLEHAFISSAIEKPSGDIILALIGETGNSVSAGSLRLSQSHKEDSTKYPVPAAVRDQLLKDLTARFQENF